MVEEKKEEKIEEKPREEGKKEEEKIEEKPQEETAEKGEIQEEKAEGKEEKKEEKAEPEKSAEADKKDGKKEEGKESASVKAAEDKEKEVKIPKKFKAFIEEIEKMSVLDLAELVKVLEKKFGVSAASAGQVVAAPGGQVAGGETKTEEKSVFNIELKAIGDKKIEVIKAVRDLIGKGLKEAKDLVDSVETGPQVIKENSKKEEAEEIKKKFEAAGATIELK